MLIKEEIKAGILAMAAAIDADNQAGKSIAETKEKHADLLADVIMNAIKSAQLTIPSGAINTTGTAAAQSNAAPVVVDGGLK